MSLNDLWFLLIAVLFTGFFFLEGFDFGVGMATRTLAKGNLERRVLINTIGPFWDANEVWLITAAGAMFAAFPHWYSTLFSGYYLVLTFILLALIARGVAFEFRSKVDNPRWQNVWDIAIFIGSLFPPLLFGIMFTSMIKGVPIDHNMHMSAGFFDIINGYSVWGGITITGLCFLHGLIFISLRTTDDLRTRARTMATRWVPVQAVLLLVLVIWTAYATDLFQARFTLSMIIVALGVVAVALTYAALRKGKEGLAFGMSGATIILMVASMFVGLFPNVMISTIDESFNLTVMNAASNPYTLKAMTIVAVCLLPFVLGYQIWSYYVFSKRVSTKDHLEY
ncbi:cytochrome D ubiquinol oxidase subunit II [Insulibacter thermoxylanivorax]|uniref:Cytochrome D ubiquinol oxidase subunit II n=1 Tax=Insulibacter thermoxylanivorax TaxID=2749268 RepID=A0A916VI59_9BACL|nr:cytochrome d ubiquinol oxidase subunit II [Insulibacter thermoxylanivorax]GFR38945.1 cytochrome D ubiquinol oxidase subunit II [Insulibacter thermoxylanivorax]